MRGTYDKDPADKDYFWRDFSDWLDEGDTITDADWTVASGDVVIDSQSVDEARAIVWLSGGTADTESQVTVHVTTAAGREKDETITIKVYER